MYLPLLIMFTRKIIFLDLTRRLNESEVYRSTGVTEGNNDHQSKEPNRQLTERKRRGGRGGSERDNERGRVRKRVRKR